MSWCGTCGEPEYKCACPSCDRCQENSAKICLSCSDKARSELEVETASMRRVVAAAKEVSIALGLLHFASHAEAANDESQVERMVEAEGLLNEALRDLENGP